MQMIYLVGQPGSGKSTLMARLTADLHRVPVDMPVPHDMLVSPVSGAIVGAEIGRRRPSFSGTDALASNIIDRAVPWVKTAPYPLLFGEGARLGVARFLHAAVTKYELTLVLLEHTDSEDWRVTRSKQLGKTQNEAWVRGRRSASRNLAAAMESTSTVLRGHPDDIYPALSELVKAGT